MLRYVFAAVVALTMACSTTPDRPPPAGDSEVTPGSGAGASSGSSGSNASPDAGDAGACNDLMAAGSIVFTSAVPMEDMPPSAGGTIVDGIYNLTAVDIYAGLSIGGSAIDTLQSTISVSQGTIQQVLVTGANSATPTETRTTLDYTPTGTTMFVRVACPNDGQTYTQGYAATDTTLILSDPTTKEVFTFTRQ